MRCEVSERLIYFQGRFVLTISNIQWKIFERIVFVKFERMANFYLTARRRVNHAPFKLSNKIETFLETALLIWKHRLSLKVVFLLEFNMKCERGISGNREIINDIARKTL